MPHDDKHAQPACYVGCAGWSFAHWRKGAFFPDGLKQKQEYDFYTHKFNSTEVNATFHAMPRWDTYKKWAEQAPPGFVYATKIPKLITHDHHFANPAEMFERFMDGCHFLADHIEEGEGRNHQGPILWQLPPQQKKDMRKLREACELLPVGARFAFEFRDPSWNCEEVYELLRKYNAALVLVGHPQYPKLDITTADFVYIRFHGTVLLHADSFSDAQLEQWTADCKRYISEGRDVYAYFNNDIDGHAPHDAVRFIKMLQDAGINVPKMKSKYKPVNPKGQLTSFFSKQGASTTNPGTATSSTIDAGNSVSAGSKPRPIGATESPKKKRKVNDAPLPKGQTSMASFFAKN